MHDVITDTKKPQTRVCRKCGQEKSLIEFHKDKADPLGKTRICKSCTADQHVEWQSSLRFRDDSLCGTPLGLKIHHAKHELACEPCKRTLGGTNKRWSKMAANPPDHGSLQAYRLHQRNEEKPCIPCCDMWNLYARSVRYDVSIDGVLLLVTLFDGLCWACKIGPAEHVDHNHDCCDSQKSCGKCVRGVLCKNCNHLEGRLAHWPKAYDIVFTEYFELTSIAQKIIAENPRIPEYPTETLDAAINRLRL